MSVVQLSEGEKILRTIHKHEITFLDDIFAIIIFIALPIIFAFIFIIIPKDYTDNFFSGDTNTGIIFIAVTWLLFAWISAWRRWTNHFLNVIVITDKRIFEVVQKGFFHREITSIGIDKIQNTRVTQSGFLASALNYGDVFIETAGELDNLDLKTIPNPNEVKKFINELQDHDKALYA